MSDERMAILVTAGVVNAGLGLAAGALLLRLRALSGERRYLAYWAAAWLLMALYSLLGAGALLSPGRSQAYVALGLLALVILYLQPAVLGLAALSLRETPPGRAARIALLAAGLFLGVLSAAGSRLPGLEEADRLAIAVAPSSLLRFGANTWFGWAFARRSPRAATPAGRVVVACSVLYGVHFLFVGWAWLRAVPPYGHDLVGAAAGLLLPMGITAGIVLAVLDDVEQTTAALEDRNAELERFTYTVSHDLKTPLTTISTFAGAVSRAVDAGRTPDLARDVERIRSAAGHMSQLLDDLLALARSGRTLGPLERVPFGEIAADARRLVQPGRQLPGLELRIAPDLPAVWCDRTRLGEVVTNLLENAMRFMGPQPEPRVEVGARAENGRPVFFVRDNGIGIDPRHHESIFGLFERLDSGSDGTGVGLALARRIVEAHGGRIWVESSGAGSGSTFCFTLPDPPAGPGR